MIVDVYRDVVPIRKATEDDCFFIFTIRNQPYARKWCYNKKPLVYSEHTAFFKRILSSPASHLFVGAAIAKPSEGPAFLIDFGYVRADVEESRIELSWAIDEKMEGQGLASLMLQAVIQQEVLVEKALPFHATIMKNNKRSINLALRNKVPFSLI